MFRAGGNPHPEQLLESRIEQKLKTRDEVLIDIYKSFYSERAIPPDSNAVVQALKLKYQQEGYLHPEQYLEVRIAESVKTREQALRELFNEEILSEHLFGQT